MSSADVSTEEIIITTKGGTKKAKKKPKKHNANDDAKSSKGFSKLIFVKESEVEYCNNKDSNNSLVNNNEMDDNQSIIPKSQDEMHGRVFTFYNQEIMSETMRSLDTKEKQTVYTIHEDNPMLILQKINNELNKLSSSFQRYILPFPNKNSSPSLSDAFPTNKANKNNANQYNDNIAGSCISIKQKVNSRRLYNFNNSYSQTTYYSNDY